MIAIVGGGPAGLALAKALDGHRVAYTLFERSSIGSTWRQAPANLTVLSPWWTNILDVRDLLRVNPLAKVPAATYLQHLRRTAARLRGEIDEGVNVEQLSKPGDGGWILGTSVGVRGPFSAVVIATGYFSSPVGPTPGFEDDGSVPVLHAAALRSYARLDAFSGQRHPVVVVGGRVTAGQTILALADRGIPCALSTRSPLGFRRHGLLAWFREMAYYVWEEIEAARTPGLRRNSYPTMEGGRNRTLVETGMVPVHPPIARIEDGQLVFADGSRSAAAGVILATGYVPSLTIPGLSVPLGPDGLPETRAFEIAAIPGVFLLGFDNLYDHRSRYLRGIRRDAGRLARRLARLSDA